MSQPPKIPASAQDAYNVLLQHYPTADAATAVLQDKVLNKPLRLHATPATVDARATRRAVRAAKRKPSKKPQPLSAAEKRKLNVYALPEKLEYSVFVPLRKLWLEYARSLSAMGGGAPAMAGRIATGDLHGAVLEVVRSRAVDRVGIVGIVVKETKNVLVIVTEGNQSKTVLKEYTVFRVNIPPTEEEKAKGRTDMVFEIQGNQMLFRAAERAGKKFKAKPMLDL